MLSVSNSHLSLVVSVEKPPKNGDIQNRYSVHMFEFVLELANEYVVL